MKTLINWIRVRCGYHELSDYGVARLLILLMFSFTHDFIHDSKIEAVK